MKYYFHSGGLIIGLLIMILYSVGGEPIYGSILSENENSNSYAKEIKVFQYGTKGLQWRADVKKAVIEESRKKILLDNIVIFYPEREFVVRAEKGTYDIKNMTVHLQGRIKGITEGFKIEANNMRYIPQDRILYAKGDVIVKAKYFIINAQEGFIRESHIFEIRGKVRTLFR